jgi:acetate kinase
VRIDDDANRADAPTISAENSRVRVVVEPTNEEWIVASHARRVIRSGAAGTPPASPREGALPRTSDRTVVFG